MLYELPDNVVANIKTFISRANLTGVEVPFFNEVITCLDNPVMQPATFNLPTVDPTTGLPIESHPGEDAKNKK